ncbi:MAG: hypothetical protein ACTHMG_14330 [Sphingomonas sp.]
MAEEVSQRRWGVTTRFTFGEERLGYRIADTSSREADYGWDAIDCTTRNRVTVAAHRPVQLLSIVTYALAIGSMLAGQFLPGISLWVTALCLASVAALVIMRTRRLLTVTFTDLDVPGGPIRIIADSRHDEILARIEAARRAYLRRALAEVDLDADPDRESQKFDWLRDNGIIDADEHARAMARLKAAADAAWHQPGATLN